MPIHYIYFRVNGKYINPPSLTVWKQRIQSLNEEFLSCNTKLGFHIEWYRNFLLFRVHKELIKRLKTPKNP